MVLQEVSFLLPQGIKCFGNRNVETFHVKESGTLAKKKEEEKYMHWVLFNSRAPWLAWYLLPIISKFQ